MSWNGRTRPGTVRFAWKAVLQREPGQMTEKAAAAVAEEGETAEAAAAAAVVVVGGDEAVAGATPEAEKAVGETTLGRPPGAVAAGDNTDAYYSESHCLD